MVKSPSSEPISSASGSNAPHKFRVLISKVFEPVPTEFVLILSSALALTGLGLIMVLSATAAQGGGESPFSVLIRQAVFAVVSIPIMLITSRLSVRFLKKAAWPVITVALILQLTVFTNLGVEINQNRNWVNLGVIQAQPSEFLKLALALWLGMILWRKRHVLGNWKHVFIPVVPVAGAAVGTVLAGNDLGTAMVMLLIVLGALFFAGIKLRMFIVPVLVIAAGVLAMALLSSNRMARILGFMREDCIQDYYSQDCYQPLHGTWSLASGGLFGLGLGNSTEKYGWLPAAANDYIFAIIGEELGLLGCLLVFILFGVYAYGTLRIIRRTNSIYVRVVSGAILVWIVGQALLNVSVVLRLFPVLGVPLPFLSQGGTSLLAVLTATGVLLALSRTLPPDAKKKSKQTTIVSE